MSHWRYQIFQHRDSEGDPYYAIHEFYTLHDGREGWTADPVPMETDTVDDMRKALLRVLRDLDDHGVRDIETGEQIDGEGHSFGEGVSGGQEGGA